MSRKKETKSSVFQGMDMTLKDLTLDEIIEQLTRLKSLDPNVKTWKVRIAHSNGVKLCVGKILGIAGQGTEGTAYLFPVPENIGTLNAISDMMAMMTCDKAANGQKCGTCPDLATCQQMKMTTESFRHVMKGGGKGR